jgi:RNA polymerase sigma-70 factor, ECF subfamily
MTAGVVEHMYQEGLRKWPGVPLTYEAFARHCATVMGTDGATEVREGADLFLCCACALGDARALRVFQREAVPVARMAVAGVRRDRDFIEETLQEVWDKLLCGPSAKVAKYSGRGPLQAWVRVTATRAAFDRCRSLGVTTARQVELTDALAAPECSAELALSRVRYGAVFQSALREAVANLSARERNALRMHVCGQCNIDEIGRAYDVHRATAARWLERARLSIVDGVRAGLRRRDVKLTDSEFVSMAQGLASVLELRLSGSFVQSPSVARDSALDA